MTFITKGVGDIYFERSGWNSWGGEASRGLWRSSGIIILFFVLFCVTQKETEEGEVRGGRRKPRGRKLGLGWWSLQLEERLISFIHITTMIRRARRAREVMEVSWDRKSNSDPNINRNAIDYRYNHKYRDRVEITLRFISIKY